MMMKRHASFPILLCALALIFTFMLVAPPAARAVEATTENFEEVTGVRPAGDLKSLPMAGKIKGEVTDPAKVKALGFRGTVEIGAEAEIFRQSPTNVTLAFPGGGNPFPIMVTITDF